MEEPNSCERVLYIQGAKSLKPKFIDFSGNQLIYLQIKNLLSLNCQ